MILFLPNNNSFIIDFYIRFMVIFGAFPGRLAQLVRALPSHGRGHWFESSIAHQFTRHACRVFGVKNFVANFVD